MVDFIIREVRSWLVVTKEFKEFSLSIFTNNWVIGMSLNTTWVNKVIVEWKPPLIGYLKLNFNGSSTGNLSLARYGCVIKEYNGTIIRAICGLLGVCNSIKAEVLSLLYGLR